MAKTMKHAFRAALNIAEVGDSHLRTGRDLKIHNEEPLQARNDASGTER
jgi:hypothetical protein